MTETLSHHEIEQQLPAAALEILEGQELARVIAHVEECPDCARLLQSYREVVASLATALPEHPLTAARSARLRARLLGRARQAAGTRALGAAAAQWTGWAVAAGLGGLLLVHHSIHRPLDYGWMVAGLLVVVLIMLAVYVRMQRARLTQLRRRLELESGEKEEL